MLRDGAVCIAIAQDISTLAGGKALAEEVSRQENRRLDILVNNAGTAWAAELEDFTEIGWHEVVDLNMKTLFFPTQFLLPALKAAVSADRPAR